MPNRSSQQQRTTAGQRATPPRTAGRLRLFGQHTPGAPTPPGAGQFGRFADTWMSRLLIGGAVLLLAIMFPLQWLRTPELVVRANLNTFSPHPGAAAATGADATSGTGAVTASYDLSEDATISASVYDSAGAVVRTLLAEQKESAGPHFVQWDGATDSGGVAADGAYRLAITARGPARSTSGSVTIAVDSTPPAVKLVNLPDGEKLKSADLLVQGVTEPGAVVQFAGSQDTVTADGGGGFTVHRQLVHGANSFTLLVHDASGNTTSVNRTVDLLDRPPVVKIDSPAEGSATNQKLVTVSGTADPGTTVRVNGQDVQPGPDGGFHADVVLDEGANVLTVDATDAVGNSARVAQHVTLDTHPPPVQIDSLADGATVHEAQVRVYGRTDPGTRLTIQARQVAVDAQGHFDTPVDLVVGNNTVHVEAQDQAGNLTSLDRSVHYDLTASSFPDLPLTGTATALALIVLAWVLFGGWFASVSLKLTTDRPAFAPGRAGDRLLVTYSLSRRARTALQVVDAQGRAVATLLPSGSRSRGDHQLLWDGSDGRGAPLPPGPYVIQAQARTLTSAVSTSATVALGGPDRSAVQVGGTYGMYGGYGAPPPGTPPQGRYVSGAGERTAGPDDPPPTPRTRLRGRN